MKHIIVLGDGMADRPCPELGGLTPLQAADTPAMDRLAAMGRNGLLHTVPEGYTPGSEIAHLSLLGYDLDRVFEGRGTLEAASMGVDIEPGEMAMRCNLICINPDGTIRNHSAGHISTEESDELISFLNEHLGDGRARFYTGVSYRHLLKVHGADKRLYCTPPHDVPGHKAADHPIRPQVREAAATADYLNDLIAKSQILLADHPVNKRRIAAGKDPANSIWPWSPGYKPAMQTLDDLYGSGHGIVISAVDLIRGLGVYAGLRPVIVPGATGLYDTDYEAKLRAALDALRQGADFVFLHIEASDEAGHEGNALLKKRTVADLGSRIIAPLMHELEHNAAAYGGPVAVALLPDHPTPCDIRTHTSDPVPFVIWHPGIQPDGVTRYSETDAAAGSYGTLAGADFIKTFLAL